MPGGFDNLPIVIKASRWRAALLLAGALAFVLAGFVAVARSESPPPALAALGFFAACAAAALLMVLDPPSLEIGPSGIVQRTLWGAQRLTWSEVQDFRPSAVCLGARAVGFDYANARKRGWVERLNLTLAGVEGMLQPGYRLGPHALADLLNQARERWLASPGGAHTAVVPPVAAGFVGARMNRKVFALGWAFLAPTALAVSRFPGLEWTAGAILLLFGSHLYAVRLHDLGRSGWWQLGLYAAQQTGAAGVALASGLDVGAYGLAFAAVIQLGFTAALAAAPGEAGANRFGPAPGEPSPLARAEAFR